MEVTKLSILKYKDKKVGYRLAKGVSVVDVPKDAFDKCGGIDYSTVDYINLFESGSLIASKEEIETGKYIPNVTNTNTIKDLYDTYISDLGGKLIGGKYVLKVCEDALLRGIAIYKLGNSNMLTNFYISSSYNDIYNSVLTLCNDLNIDKSVIEVDDYIDSATIKVEGVSLYDLDYYTDMDILLYNVRHLLLKLLKVSNGELAF